MIVKERKFPIKIKKRAALHRRIKEDHPKRELITSDFNKSLAGYKGEKSVDYFLNYFPTNEFHIFHDLRLPHEDYHFQIDTLLLSNSFALILEVKNIYGTLFFDSDFNQLIRTTKEDIEECFPDPILQVKRQRLQLLHWIHSKYNLTIPVECFVVISNSSSIIKTNNHELTPEIVIHSHALIDKIEIIKCKYKNDKIDNTKRRRITKHLLNNHEPGSFPVLERYDISKQDIINGVVCPSCQKLSMIRKHATWLCIHCYHVDKYAHQNAIDDYFLLFDSPINNKLARDYLKIDSIYTANRLLQSMNLDQSGSTKGKLYHPPPN
ncbi:NERD domain-containing protein [Bacillus sp. 31A1R]|uniref:NERD domain-containing protein n=1 Tax=Robertmurraya mangrovi TaxID=3098077 RepID=A0ABU5J514_9BACI|nr:NERD domain-containing protein [Bacillus sp. 31A1R]MDZ5474514.1 NERD domain-containing protein [Bacillus sp. 31A1R]